MPERVVNFSLRSEGVAELDFVPDIFLPDWSNPRFGKSKTTGWKEALQLPSLAKRCYSEIQKYQRHGDGDADKPAGSVARPSAQGGVQPSQRENGKDRGDDFVKKLAERAPETTETALLLRRGGCACGR